MTTAVASLTWAAAAPAPTATLLVASDPAPTAPDTSLLLEAAPAPIAATVPGGSDPRTDAVAAASWVQDVGTWGVPLLVGGALLLALTGPSWRRYVDRRRPLS